MFYSSLDIAIVVVSFLAFLWLRVFEVVEERTLEKNTGRLQCSSVVVVVVVVVVVIVVVIV